MPKCVEKEPPKSIHRKLNSLIIVMFKGNKVVTRIPDDKVWKKSYQNPFIAS